MLALVSSSTTTLRACSFCEAGSIGVWKNGRAKPRPSKHSARQRNASSSRFSNRLRRVTRGGDACKNMSELNGIRSRVVRRMR